MAHGYINKNQIFNKTLTLEKESGLAPFPVTPRVDPLALKLARDMDDTKSLPFYRKLVEMIDPYILLKARGEVLEEKNIKKSKGAMFTYLVKRASPQTL
ncbi:MAG: hypothetical protein ACE5LX_08600 [Nitrospinota bacterium]